MKCVIKVGEARAKWWKSHMKSLLPEIEFFLHNEPFDKQLIDLAIVWKPENGWLKSLSNLKCIISMGSGIDHILSDPELPKDLPIIKTTADDLKIRMREYVILHTLKHHRNLNEVIKARNNKEWKQIIEPPANKRTVGVMGLGNLGLDCARALKSLDFMVNGWSKSEKEIEGINTFTGINQITDFIKDVEILICMLPLTSETRGILNFKLFEKMKKNSCLINVARGEHLVEEDLIKAIEKSIVKEATLDVFHSEPLPENHIFWQNSKIFITPHIASLLDPEAGGKDIAQNILKFINGEFIKNLIPPGKDY
jgi:glyoxylate/hydroxypyruvate reductase A